LKLSLFDFALPQENIALRPAIPREAARLLYVHNGLSDHTIADLPSLLQPGDLLVFNDTKVFPAELHGTRTRAEHVAHITFTLHKRINGETWAAFAKPAKRVQVGEIVIFDNDLEAIIESKHEGEITLRFNASDEALFAAFHRVGQLPLPPYISGKRKQDAQDLVDYQTSFAKDEGSVAAPTAGLHFTKDLRDKLTQKGIDAAFVTLHVGAGTFLPVKTDDTRDHKMHAEWGEISQSTMDKVKAAKRVIAVGTTSLRLLESANGKAFSGETSIFITPGYTFNTVHGLITNFHLPKSTLFMLVSSLMGLETMQAAYKHAIESGYRFYSYGDANLLIPQTSLQD
jgi:S-adenosylmethionine:tRNA ribosyltransferase-isomerase